jgi:hypothetical protein
MSVAAIALAASGVAVLFAGPASAKSSGPKGKTTCTAMNGSTSSESVTISGCSSTGTPGTGGSSKPLSILTLASGGPVDWVNGTVTAFASPALTSTNAKHCPGYVKPPKGSTTTPAEPSADKFSGAVTSDNSGLKMPGKYKGEVCISQSGVITAAKALKVS